LGWEEVVEFAELSGCRSCATPSEHKKNASGIITTAASFL
jgi:hypothetical protein